MNFDKEISRKGTNSIKWDQYDKYLKVEKKENTLSMWVADMDLPVFNGIQEAIMDRAKHPIYGYTGFTDKYYNAIIDWMKNRFNWKVKKDWISYIGSVVTGISLAIKAYTEIDDKILIQTPVYFPFYKVIKNNNRKLVKSKLKIKENKYIMDFKDIEKKMKSGVKLMILCSPHNPVGRVWTKDELAKLGNLAKKYNVIIVSDEIHSDLVYSESKHTPIAKISQDLQKRVVILTSPSKTFNIAGLSMGNAIIIDKSLRNKYNKIIKELHIYRGNIFGIEALKAGYNFGEKWVINLNTYLEKNRDYTYNYIRNKMPKIKVYKPEGTFLLWMDISEIMNGVNNSKKLYNESGLLFHDGLVFGKNGKGFLRMNFAVSKSVLEEALKRLEKFHNKK